MIFRVGMVGIMVFTLVAIAVGLIGVIVEVVRSDSE